LAYVDGGIDCAGVICQGACARKATCQFLERGKSLIVAGVKGENAQILRCRCFEMAAAVQGARILKEYGARGRRDVGSSPPNLDRVLVMAAAQEKAPKPRQGIHAIGVS
jgi:hypothetical protein